MTDDRHRGSSRPEGRDWVCAGCGDAYHGKPDHVTEDPFQCFCSDECYERVQSDDHDRDDSDDETYDWVTVMDGPDVDGRERIWLGRETEPWEQLDEDGGTRMSAEPVQHIPLPWPMDRDEVDDFLEQDDRGEDYLEQFTLEAADQDHEAEGETDS